MNTNDILSKVTLNFAGGGKLNLSDYAPYISNGETAVEGVIEATDEPVHKESVFDRLCYTDKDMYVGIFNYDGSVFIYENGNKILDDVIPINDFIDNINNYNIYYNITYPILYKKEDFIQELQELNMSNIYDENVFNKILLVGLNLSMNNYASYPTMILWSPNGEFFLIKNYYTFNIDGEDIEFIEFEPGQG